MRKVTKILLCAALCLPLLHGCTPARKKAAYTIYPIGWLINVLSGNTMPTVSVQDDSDPVVVQKTQLKDNYAEILKSSKVFFHIGSLEPYITVMDKTIAESGVNEKDLSSLNVVYDFARYREVISDNEIKFLESPYYDGYLFENVDVLSKDLCLWNDPSAMLGMAQNILDWLEETDPANAETYQKNYKNLNTDLINLDAKYQSFASSLAKNKKTLAFVTMTASYGNWQKTYGFQVYPLVLSRYGVLPNELQLKAIEARILKDNVKYIVYETNMSADMTTLYEQVQKDLNLTRVDLSNLSALTGSQIDTGKDYLSIMYENLSQLETIQPQAIPLENETTAG